MMNLNSNENCGGLAASLVSRFGDLRHRFSDKLTKSKNTAPRRPGRQTVYGRRACGLLAGLLAAGLGLGGNAGANAQICAPVQPGPVFQSSPVIESRTFRLVPETVVEKQEVTAYKTVEETSTRLQQVTELKPLTRTEYRQRRSTVLKPVTETEMKTERTTVLEPVTETVMQERQRQVTEYVEETGYREEQVMVPRTIEETQMREQQTVVRKPVTETYYRQTPETSYSQVTTLRPQVVDQGALVNQLVVQPGNERNRLRFFPGTYYTDPVTLRQVYRRPGFYFTNVGQPASAALVPTYVPNYQVQQVAETSLVPQTTMKTEAVEVTKYVDQVVTEKVPVTVRRVENEVVTQRVPYSVSKPVTRTITESVPVERTYMKERVVEREVPVSRTVMQSVEKIEPYEVQVKEMVEVTRTQEVPFTERKLVPIKEIREVPRTVLRREEIDIFGNPIVRDSSIMGSTGTIMGSTGTAGSSFGISESSTIGASLYREATPSTAADGTPILDEARSTTETSGTRRMTEAEYQRLLRGESGNNVSSSTLNSPASDPASAAAPQTTNKVIDESVPMLRSMKPYLGESESLMGPSASELKPLLNNTKLKPYAPKSDRVST